MQFVAPTHMSKKTTNTLHRPPPVSAPHDHVGNHEANLDFKQMLAAAAHHQRREHDFALMTLHASQLEKRGRQTGLMRPPILLDSQPTIQIRKVWAHNLESEFELIRSAIVNHRNVAMDTEFPGTIYLAAKPYLSLTPKERYALLKANVDNLKLIQIGLTLSDSTGRLPDLGTPGAAFVWEFNFRDFDPNHDPHNSESIKLLREHGINFGDNRTKGIDSRRFARLLLTSGLICNGSRVSWVAFSSAYDFAYLIKILTRQNLPDTIRGFLRLLGYFFGRNVFDMKHLMKFCSLKLRGGLEKLASDLKVTRVAGRCHQAGSDSLLTSQVFLKMRSMLSLEDSWKYQHNGVLCGLQVC